MIKINARILTDVEYVLDIPIEDGKEIKRKLKESMARDGYVNTEFQNIKTERIDSEELDLDMDLSEFAQSFMYGKP